MKVISTALVLALLGFAGCETSSPNPAVPRDSTTTSAATSSQLSLPREHYHDKVLGLLIGSAIGDAMGAPTEMWGRSDIQLDYGFVDDLGPMVRTASAEGIWKSNLPAGGTTDDTRWKALTIEFLLAQDLDQATPQAMARHIMRVYQSHIDTLKATEGFHPKPYEDNLMKMAWLQEWALVAKPYAADDLPGYADALSKFYGGEMTCAGMLYSPIWGAVHAGAPDAAYQLGYHHAIYDIGYARDMTSLVAAMTAAAFDSDATPTSVINVNRTVDPESYFASRLVGRSSYRFYQHARKIVSEARAVSIEPMQAIPAVPAPFQHLKPLAYLQLKSAFDQLDAANESIAFHPGEIYLITLTAMLFHEFDFEGSMTFITNYGRDNDTVAAIAGAILGAYWGADRLPPGMTQKVLEVNRNELGLDLVQLADQMTAWRYAQ